MKHEDIIALTKAIGPIIAATLKNELLSFEQRINAVEQKIGAVPKSVPSMQDMQTAVTDAVVKALADQPKVPTADEIAKLVPVPVVPTADEIAKLVPVPVVPTADEIAKLVPPAANGIDGKDGADGKDVDMEAVRSIIVDELKMFTDAIKVPTADEIAKLVPVPVVPTAEEVAALIPAPADGKDASPDQIAKAVMEEIAKLPTPKDGVNGVGLAGALIDKDGVLNVTLTDGSVVKLGNVVGKDGAPGRDGMGFEDIVIGHDGSRTFKFAMVRGDHTKEFEFKLPVVLDRGVFKDGTEYEQGDGVTSQGSFWIAQKATSARPGTNDEWRLAVKKGRDGKDSDAAKASGPVKVKL